MTTTEAAFYDATMGEGTAAALPLEDSPWRPLYEEAARWVNVWHPVVDLGCGTGRFLRALEQNGHRGHRAGVDFSEVVIRHARGYLTSSRNEFTVADLREWHPNPGRAGNTTYTCLEVLEHLTDDLDLVGRVPPGHQFVFSVPNYESEAHLRWFRGFGAVWERYEPFLTFRRWSLISFDDRKAVHVCDATRRLDSQ